MGAIINNLSDFYTVGFRQFCNAFSMSDENANSIGKEASPMENEISISLVSGQGLVYSK